MGKIYASLKETEEILSEEEVKKESKKENPNTGDAGSLTSVMSALLSAVALFVSRKIK